MSDALLARELDSAIAGEPANDEARALAALLVAVAEPARVPVSGTELERALAATRPVARTKDRRRYAGAALVFACVAIAVAFFARSPGTDTQARAARAVDATFFVVEQVKPASPKLFPASTVAGYVDGATGRAHVRVDTAAETVVSKNGSVARWTESANTLTFAPSCAVLPGGCAEAVDPLTLYVEAVDDPGVHSRRVAGGYELTLRHGRLEQRVVVDGRTFVPRRIERLQDGRLVSTTTFTVLERQHEPPGADAWAMAPHPGARVVQLTGAGAKVRVVSVSPLRRPVPGTRWLGPSYDGSPARVELVRLTGARHATRVRYGSVVVWNYGEIAPPAIAAARTAPAKVFVERGALIHVYFGKTPLVVAEASFGDANVAIVSRAGDKLDVLTALEQLVRVRRAGSP
jgi:hypothetical protein